MVDHDQSKETEIVQNEKHHQLTTVYPVKYLLNLLKMRNISIGEKYHVSKRKQMLDSGVIMMNRWSTFDLKM